jgi:hypothetical protein
MLNYIKYKDNFYPSSNDDKILYSKAFKFKSMIPFITNEMWYYIIDNISQYDFKIFINDSNSQYNLQIPTCSFGSFLYHILKQYILEIIYNMSEKNLLDTQFTSVELCNILNDHDISIKHYLNFIESVKRKLSTSPIKLSHNVDSTIKFKVDSKFRLKLYPFISYTNCCFKKNVCSSFETACQLSHTYCINEYLELGMPLTESIFNSITSSNNIGILNKLLCSGLDFPKKSFIYACSSNKELIIDFIIKAKNDPCFYLNLHEIFNYGKVEDSLKSLTFLVKFYPSVLYPSFNTIKNILDHHWLSLDETIHSTVIDFYLSNELFLKRKYTFSEIESNLLSHFIR